MILVNCGGHVTLLRRRAQPEVQSDATSGADPPDIETVHPFRSQAIHGTSGPQATRDAALREGHLQHALNSRIAIEQAKGMIAEHNRIDMDEAFSRLRAYARNHNRRLTEVAEALVAGTTKVDAIKAATRPSPPSAHA